MFFLTFFSPACLLCFFFACVPFFFVALLSAAFSAHFARVLYTYRDINHRQKPAAVFGCTLPQNESCDGPVITECRYYRSPLRLPEILHPSRTVSTFLVTKLLGISVSNFFVVELIRMQAMCSHHPRSKKNRRYPPLNARELLLLCVTCTRTYSREVCNVYRGVFRQGALQTFYYRKKKGRRVIYTGFGTGNYRVAVSYIPGKYYEIFLTPVYVGVYVTRTLYGTRTLPLKHCSKTPRCRLAA